MNNLAFNIWLGLGIFLVVIEFLLPGLVMVFVGMGALTVALGMYLGHVESIPNQFLILFLSSLFYLLTLRFLVLRFFPTDSIRANINEDDQVIGSVVKVVEDILQGKLGRISHSDSTWQARSESNVPIKKGEDVKIIGRDNITWVVEKIED